MNVNHSRHNHNNLQSKVNLKVSDFSANSYSNLNTHKLARVNEHLLGLSGSCSVSGKIIAPIKSYPLWSREEVKLDDAMLITSSTTTEGKPQKKKGAKGMLNKMKKTLRKSTGGGSKSNLETSHNLQQPHSAEQPPPAASSNTSGSVAPSSELSRSSYVPSDDDSESSILAENSVFCCIAKYILKISRLKNGNRLFFFPELQSHFSQLLYRYQGRHSMASI